MSAKRIELHATWFLHSATCVRELYGLAGLKEQKTPLSIIACSSKLCKHLSYL